MIRRILLIVALFFLNISITHADSPDIIEPDYGNLFLCAQHALAAEMRNQPPDALLMGARVLHTKGECYRDRNWLTSWGLAQDVLIHDQHNCILYYSCQAYFLYMTIDPDVREPIAEAVNQAMTENPPVPMFHFDAADAPLVSWWMDTRACPNGITYAGTMRFC